MSRQLATDWSRELDAIARRLNPAHDAIFESWPMDYYWSAYQTEWATDLMFKTPRALEGIYPALVEHAMRHFKSPDVMRFLSRKAHGNFIGEITLGWTPFFRPRTRSVKGISPTVRILNLVALSRQARGRWGISMS